MTTGKGDNLGDTYTEIREAMALFYADPEPAMGPRVDRLASAIDGRIRRLLGTHLADRSLENRVASLELERRARVAIESGVSALRERFDAIDKRVDGLEVHADGIACTCRGWYTPPDGAKYRGPQYEPCPAHPARAPAVCGHVGTVPSWSGVGTIELRCDRSRGHAGDHLATAIDGQKSTTWPNTNAAPLASKTVAAGTPEMTRRGYKIGDREAAEVGPCGDRWDALICELCAGHTGDHQDKGASWRKPGDVVPRNWEPRHLPPVGVADPERCGEKGPMPIVGAGIEQTRCVRIKGHAGPHGSESAWAQAQDAAATGDAVRVAMGKLGETIDRAYRETPLDPNDPRARMVVIPKAFEEAARGVGTLDAAAVHRACAMLVRFGAELEWRRREREGGVAMYPQAKAVVQAWDDREKAMLRVEQLEAELTELRRGKPDYGFRDIAEALAKMDHETLLQAATRVRTDLHRQIERYADRGASLNTAIAQRDEARRECNLADERCRAQVTQIDGLKRNIEDLGATLKSARHEESRVRGWLKAREGDSTSGAAARVMGELDGTKARIDATLAANAANVKSVEHAAVVGEELAALRALEAIVRQSRSSPRDITHALADVADARVRRAAGANAAAPACRLAAPGWRCTRAKDHDGPCTAVTTGEG